MTTPAPATARGRLPAVLAALAPVAALALVATVPAPPAPPEPAAATVEPVRESTVACPPAPAGRGTTAEVLSGRVPRGRVTTSAPAADATVARGTGPAARGTFAARVDRTDTRLAVLRCGQPAARWWFAGAGGDLGHSGVLHLANVDEGPAVVDVTVHGATGSVDVAGTRGLTLAPGESLRLRLAEVAPGSPELAVEVNASRGRVAAALADAYRSGREWLPPGPPPGRTVVVPAGVVDGRARATLLVTNPGDSGGLVEVQALGPDGTFTPVGLEPVPVEPGAVTAVRIDAAVLRALGDAAALRLTSEVPVVAAVRSVRPGDHAVAAGAAPMRVGEPAVLLAAGRRTAVRLAAGDGGATVDLVERSARGRVLAEETVTVAADGSLERRVGRRTASVTLTVGAGELHAAAVHTGPGVAVQPAPAVPWTVVRPAVRPPVP